VVEEVIFTRCVISIIIAKLLSMALAHSAVNCIGGVWLLSLEVVSLDWLGVQCIVLSLSVAGSAENHP